MGVEGVVVYCTSPAASTFSGGGIVSNSSSSWFSMAVSMDREWNTYTHMHPPHTHTHAHICTHTHTQFLSHQKCAHLAYDLWDAQVTVYVVLLEFEELCYF